MATTLKNRIHEDMKTAMRAKQQLRLGTIRMLMAAIKQREIDDRTTLDDSGVLNAINKMIKQRRDSERQFKEANRTELADKEAQEIEILQAYLPQQMTEAEINEAVLAAIKTTGANSMKDMGKVMGLLKSQLEGQADMSVVSANVKENLTTTS